MNKIKLIVGLLNPGARYIDTRHNVGAWYVNLLIEKHNLTIKNSLSFFGFTSSMRISSDKIYLLMPNTFMNLSGQAVKAISTYYNILPEEILIAHDELDFPAGIAKFKYGGGHGGHNGLRDIIKQLGNSKNFYRLRIGVGRPRNRNHISQFVLSEPPNNEKKLICNVINEAIICTEIWLTHDYHKAINRLNAFNS
ncbi:aminoacyl-tRNA hydrolase [Candidatus Pantoea edessiphila]|uniref:Peptidyl-tRNA hydrolase n=1 Tax=Candidatus Pantoea edessiphila TaxID=2044610 RepID=A0A2P5SWX4_9GAMM|nr:aminoacyl-tRNA hydrolase [Candidatus Pantoea edessiphila]PPI86824.1 aminoacyl-tRNA hydrolase [Candidatus Pantoea edessiphila]